MTFGEKIKKHGLRWIILKARWESYPESPNVLYIHMNKPEQCPEPEIFENSFFCKAPSCLAKCCCGWSPCYSL